MNRIKVLIADDHAFFREGLRALLRVIPDLEVAGEAASGVETIDRALALQPDVILMDVQMPDLNGIDATRRILETSPHIGILMLTMFEEDDSVFAAMRAGARGYVLKGADRGELGRAIKAAASGEAIFSPAIAQRMIQYFAAISAQPSRQPFPQLSDRERDVLDLIAQGLNNTDIAARLVLSQKTVRNHVSNIFAKMQVADRPEAIVRARDAGLGQRHP
ncbi:MAG: Regulatory protein, LuxR:Response regulator receiver [uncultured Chloroflexia bacterium]|uniref:Regulatory protein, LuxR:Response regulator receiver n=1 Tax=uncultured Chloroflexia bacterium TaxID=1672391 RepID=A0A6J4ILG4_9CHLR|nr:MAG: Regulatory protein, LuxR:Response regulator receiver [uncultured Chloroflexia bacterium]